MEKELSHGKMVGNTRVNTLMTKSMVMVFSTGQMEESMMVSGKTESNMELAHTHQHQELRKKVNGSLERELNGFEFRK